MTFAGVVVGCWLAIAALAFLAISGLGRLAERGDVDSDLAIVGEAELRMLVGGHTDRLRAFQTDGLLRAFHTDGLRAFHTDGPRALDAAGLTAGDRFGLGHDHAGFTR